MEVDGPANAQPRYTLLLLPIVLALLTWWFTTPDPALVRSLFWLLPIMAAHRLLMTLAQVQWSWHRWQQVNQLSLFAMVNAALLAMLLVSWPQAIVVLPGFAPIPQVNVFEEQLPRRLSVWIPMSDARCWDAPLPCTPQINTQLRRRGTNIQHGFQVLSPYPSLLASIESSSTDRLPCQPPVAVRPSTATQRLNFAWVACRKPKG